MKDQSPEIQQLIQDLYTLQRSWKSKFFNKKHLEDVITDLGETGEPNVVTHLAGFLFNPSHKIAITTANAIASIIETLQPSQFVRLDESLRDYQYYSAYELKPKDVESFGEFNELAWVPLVVASCYHNGYVREASIKQLPNLDERIAIPFLLLRANDWVKQVRETANEALRTKITTGNASNFVSYLYLASRLSIGRARKENTIIELVHELLSKKGCLDSLLQGLKSTEKFTRRTCFDIALEGNLVPLEDVARIGLETNDPIVRISVAKALTEKGVVATNTELLEFFLSDCFMPVRKETISALRQLEPAQSEKYYFQLMLDSSPTIRSMCRLALSKIDNTKDKTFFADYYQQALTRPATREVFGAVSGFGETATSEMDSVIIPLLKHPSARVRKAVVRGLFKLRPNTHQDTFIDTLMNDTPGVSREAKIALSMIRPELATNHLWELFNTSSREATTLNVLWLINQKSKWERMPMLLKSITHSNQKVRDRAMQYLTDWVSRFNKSFTQATDSQLDDAEQALQTIEEQLDSNFVSQLRFYLKG